MPSVYWHFKVYKEDDTYLYDRYILQPEYSDGELRVDGRTANAFQIMNEKFGTSSIPLMKLRHSSPPISYRGLPSVENVCNVRSAGIVVEDFANTIQKWKLAGYEDRYIQIEFSSIALSDNDFTRRMDITYKYIRNGTTYDTITHYIQTSYRDWNGMHIGEFMGRGIPLPDVNFDIFSSRVQAIAKYMWSQSGEDAEPYFVAAGCSSYNTSTHKTNFANWLMGVEPEIQDPDNPYWNGGTSNVGGGGGNFSEDSDNVDVDQLPTVDAVGTGFATLFTPSKSQLKSLADIMWDSNVFTALQNLVENITGMFTSLAIVPFEVTAGSTVEVTWFGFAWTEIYLTLASKQYYEFDMGSINMKSDDRIFTSGSALDYSPFSSLGIFLPFIGFQELDIDECRDSVINLKYRIDILSGTCVALISLNGNTVYQFSGNCLSQIPITNENMQSLVTDAVQVGIAAAATHSAKGAVGAAEASMGEAETAKETKAAKAALGHAEAHLASAKAGLASATANASMGMKPVYGKAGAISASASLLAAKQPYLFLRTPRQSIPEHYQRYCGFPSNMSGKLNTFSGYTVVEDIRLNGLVATSPEVAEIYELLKGGVII